MITKIKVQREKLLRGLQLSDEKLGQSYINIFNEMDGYWKALVKSRETKKETNFIERVLKKKGTILDLCCGTGRHSIILRGKGWNVVGIDISKNLLTIAKRKMKREGIDIPIVRADMRNFPFRNQIFESIICMFTSFGYLPSTFEDIKSLKEIRRTIRKKGKFLLDVANRKHLINIFTEREWADYGYFYMLEKRCLSQQKSRLTSQWTIIRKDSKIVRSFQHNVRLYTLRKLKKMLNNAGLKLNEVYGGYDGREFSLDSPRMILSIEIV